MLKEHSPITQALLGTLFTWALTAAGAALVVVIRGKQVSGNCYSRITRPHSNSALPYKLRCTHRSMGRAVSLSTSMRSDRDFIAANLTSPMCALRAYFSRNLGFCCLPFANLLSFGGVLCATICATIDYCTLSLSLSLLFSFLFVCRKKWADKGKEVSVRQARLRP